MAGLAKRGTAGAGRTLLRREQARAAETRRAILDASLGEFAERGFEGASVRRIGARAVVDHTLVTYHFRTKDALWRACALHVFGLIEAKLADIPTKPELRAADRLRAEFRAFLGFTVDHASFHNFMLRETQSGSPRLDWLIDTVLGPMRSRLMGLIRAAQADGDLVKGDPDLLYYLLITITAAPSTLSGEMSRTIGYSLDSEAAAERYWRLAESILFR